MGDMTKERQQEKLEELIDEFQPAQSTHQPWRTLAFGW